MTIRFWHAPEALVRPTRRQFLGALGAAAAYAVVPPTLAGSLNPRVPRLAPGEVADEAFWELVKAQFPLRLDVVVVNAANLCPAPFPVIQAVQGLTGDVDADASFHNRGKFAELHAEARTALAAYVGADAIEIVITRNTSEGNNLVVNGLDLGPGDEVVIWDQNHPTNAAAWDVAARRRGFQVRRVSTPPQPTSPEELLDVFVAALGPRTRVLAFSDISNVSGMALPDRDLCAAARDRGILTLVDGAQSFGFRRLDLHALGCDFYTASAHKWFTGPKEAGLLYVRKERIGEVWPSMVAPAWQDDPADASVRLGSFGQRDDATVAAMGTAVAFRTSIGQERAEARVRELCALIKTEIPRRVAGARLITPAAPELSGGVVVFALPDVDPRAAFERLYRDHRVGAAAMSGEQAGLRICPHIYNTREDVERVLTAVETVADSSATA